MTRGRTARSQIGLVAIAAIATGAVLLTTTAADAEDAEQLFEKAADLVGAGEIEAAVVALERVAAEFPESREAAEALFLAGELHEDRLDDPTAAAALYRRITTDFGGSRVAVAAGRRLATLESMLGSTPGGGARLGRFLRLRREAATLPADEALSRAAALLAEDPSGANADRVRVWMAGVALRDEQREHAEALYREAMDARDPDIAYEATMAAAGLARDRRAFGEARALAERLDPGGVPGRLEARREALLSIDRAELRESLRRVAVGLLLLVPLVFIALLFWTLRSPRAVARSLWPPPIETIYMAPIGVAFLGASFTGYHGIAVAVAMVLVAGVMISWLSGASLRASSRSAVMRVLHPALAAVAVIAACYVALHHNRLLDLIVSTVRFGPDV